MRCGNVGVDNGSGDVDVGLMLLQTNCIRSFGNFRCIPYKTKVFELKFTYETN